MFLKPKSAAVDCEPVNEILERGTAIIAKLGKAEVYDTELANIFLNQNLIREMDVWQRQARQAINNHRIKFELREMKFETALEASDKLNAQGKKIIEAFEAYAKKCKLKCDDFKLDIKII